jgi:type II secretory pathway pseudopilin PulG
MTLFWLARASYRTGNRPEAARAMSRFLKEYPGHPLTGTVEDDLLKLAAQYDQGYTIARIQDPGTRKQPTTSSSPVSGKPDSPPPVVAENTVASAASAQQAAPAPASGVAPLLPPPVEGTPPLEKTVVAQEKTAETSPPVETPPDTAVRESGSQETRRETAPASGTGSRDGEQQVTSKQERVVGPSAPQDDPRKAPVRKTRRNRQQEQKEALREKAIAAYRATIQRYPGTPAAAEAAERLRTLGATSAIPVVTARPVVPGDDASRRVVTVEVEQFADLGFTVATPTSRPEAGAGFSIPIEVINTGNGADSFSLETGFPSGYFPRFAAAATPDLPLAVTPVLGAGETWRGVLRLDIPAADVDGHKLRYPVRVTSRFNRSVSRTSEILVSVSAPLLRGIMKPVEADALPGETVAYRVTLLNIGSAPARTALLRLDYPLLLEPVAPAGFRQEPGALVMDNVRLASGESRELTVTFRVKTTAPARQELVCRGELANPTLRTRETFVSGVATVRTVHGVTLAAPGDRLAALPGQTITIPLVVTNTGNVREPVTVGANLPAGFSATIYLDANGNGMRDAGEPALVQTGPLAPKESCHLIMEIGTPGNAADGSETMVPVTAETAGGTSDKTSASLRVVFARPRVELSATGGGGRLKPGEVASLEVICLNRGLALARDVTVRSFLPDQLELIATEPAAVTARNGELTWTIPQLGAGEKRSLRLIYRVRPGVVAGASLEVTSRVTYEDHQGNRY